jgi:hypothetical protein
MFDIGPLGQFNFLLHIFLTMPGYMLPLMSLISLIVFSLITNFIASPDIVSFSVVMYSTKLSSCLGKI